ncbi:Biotin biosynthesis cytochrome P450 [Geodia barretti]|uniref:Biotin biosynthesis cytochrome P450 n=1 Tax=Geodia barretti TaxID=519541 RepID=A0AA35RF93_GEOBA|nr:Biotin biosynthesis cytochrome P450 [Geodia barretti]
MVSTINDNPFSLEAIYQPYDFFARLRDTEPVHYNEEFEVWMVSSWEHLVWVTRHPEAFSSSVFARDTRAPNPPIDEDDMEIYNFIKKWQVSRFIQYDQKRYNPGVSGPDHVDMRRVMHGYFTPKSMEMWRPLVQSAIDELLDAVEEKGQMDVMSDLATPLPLLVIARMLGIPDSDRPILRSLAKDLRFLNRVGPDRMGPLSQAVQNLQEYLGPLVADRVKSPKDDLISVVAEGERQGIFDRDMTVNNVMLLLSAGHETTINLICNGTLAFTQHPDQWAILKSDPEGKTVRATEEALRYDSPVKSIQRIAMDDIEIGGQTIRKDDRVRWFISGANRDPKVFDRADDFDVERYPNQHVAFGSGIHHCLGATLARLEGQEIFRNLANRFDTMELEIPVKDVEYDHVLTFRAVESLPVKVTSAR